METWKRIEESEHHEISSVGRIRSLDRVIYRMNPWGFVSPHNVRGKVLSLFRCGNGYLGIRTAMGAKNLYIHRLVAKAFIPNPLGLKEINHIDGNKKNNQVENLEWCTRAQNSKHATHVLNKRGGQFGKNRVRIPAGG